MTKVVPVTGYSKLVRAPQRPTYVIGHLLFRDLLWDIKVRPMSFDEDGLANTLVVSVIINFIWHERGSHADTHFTLEILDETGEHTVFHKESSRETLEDQTFGIFSLCVRRRELEASSCVSALHDEFTLRCTLKKEHKPTKRRCLLGSLLCKSNAVFQPPPPQVAMVGSHAHRVLANKLA
ncbi:hypothetical protein ZWY2020_000352 [Hordeum vulgare]|nr:hypothetical protein ZWY2020_000352 [Hordeum vulgare]